MQARTVRPFPYEAPNNTHKSLRVKASAFLGLILLFSLQVASELVIVWRTCHPPVMTYVIRVLWETIYQPGTSRRYARTLIFSQKKDARTPIFSPRSYHVLSVQCHGPWWAHLPLVALSSITPFTPRHCQTKSSQTDPLPLWELWWSSDGSSLPFYCITL